MQQEEGRTVLKVCNFLQTGWEIQKHVWLKVIETLKISVALELKLSLGNCFSTFFFFPLSVLPFSLPCFSPK